jgi:uncharacterized membrane protein
MLHLLHPFAVHFSIALLVLGGVGESLGILIRRPALERYCGTLVLLGTASLIPTVVTGFLAQNVLEPSGGVRAILDRHERIGLLVLGAFLLLALWKAWRGGTVPDGQRVAFALALLGAVALAGFGAYLGGRMVYGFGLGVAG